MLLTIFVSTLHTSHAIAAGGGKPVLDASVSKSSPTVGETVSISLFIYNRYCVSPEGTYYSRPDKSVPCDSGYTEHKDPIANANWFDLQSTGSGNTLSSSKPQFDSGGRASVNFSSTTAESKVVSLVFLPGNGESDTIGSISVAFEAAASTAPGTNQANPVVKPVAPSTEKPAPQPNTATVEQSKADKPAPPIASGLKVAGESYSSESSPKLKTGEPITISGKTVPNGIVTLVVHSTPQTFMITADDDGNWSQTVTNLEDGDHYAEASVTDPATNQTSEMTKLMEFSVIPKDTATKVVASVESDAGSNSKNLLLTGVLISFLAAIAFVGYKFFKKRQKALPL